MKKDLRDTAIITLTLIVCTGLIALTVEGICRSYAALEATTQSTEAVTITTEAPETIETTTEAATITTEAPESIEPETESWIPDGAAELIGRTIWGEADGVKDPAERAAVAWCILNRVDAWGQSIEEVVTAPRQFHGYRDAETWGECPQRHIDLAADVLERWAAEKAGAENVGRVLPAGYLYFVGDGERNHFSIEFLETNYWDWTLASPY